MKNFKFCFATSPAKHTDYTVSRLRGYKFASTDKAKGETVIVFILPRFTYFRDWHCTGPVRKPSGIIDLS